MIVSISLSEFMFGTKCHSGVSKLLNMRIKLGIFQHRSEIWSTVAILLARRSSLRVLPTDVTVGHRHVITNLITDSRNDAEHRVLEVHHYFGVKLWPMTRRSRTVLIENLRVTCIAIHSNVVSAQALNMLSHHALKLSLNRTTVGVAIDLKTIQKVS